MSLLLNVAPEDRPQFAANARRAGIVMSVIGVIGIVLPNLVGLTLNLFIGSIFLFSSAVLAYMAWYSRSSGMGLWLKPFVLLAVGLLVLMHPAVVLSVLGLLLAMYFLLAGFAGTALAMEVRPNSGWVFLLFSGLRSLAMGLLVLSVWPLGSAWMIGLLIGINLLFEGFALISLAKQMESTLPTAA